MGKSRIQHAGLCVIVAMLILASAPISAIAADAKTPRRFNSKLSLQVYIAPEERTPFLDPMLLGRTPAAAPLVIPPDKTWFVVPDSSVDSKLLVKEIEAQKIPGLSPRVGDLQVLKDVPDLEMIFLRGSPVSDADLKNLAGLKSLRWLDLLNTNITDAGLANLEGLTSLQILELGKMTRITDAGLAHLKDLTNLKVLELGASPITGSGLKYLARLKSLQVLDLWTAPTTDAGLESLENLTSLQTFWLTGTKVTDAGMFHLGGLTNLKELHIESTSVSDQGAQSLRQILPQCNVMQ